MDSADVLRQLRSQAPPALHAYFPQFQDFYDRKLWHQLTVKLREMAQLAEAKPLLLPLYHRFIQPWEMRMSKSALVQLMQLTAQQCADPKAAAEFMDGIAEKVKDEPEAYALAQLEAAHYRLLLQQMDLVKSTIEQCTTTLDQLHGVQPVVHACLYRVSADYNKAKADYNQYYKNALLYLSCIRAEDLTKQEKQERAYDLSLAALLGDTIYNFGELLMHPVLNELKGTPHEWLVQLLFCFNAGDIGKFDLISAQFTKQPLLVQNSHFLRQKICLMALIEAVFKRMGTLRRIPFATIGQETRLPADEIEHLIMKALSLGLVRGRMDQIDQALQVDWVTPRVLDQKQIGSLCQRVMEWRKRVESAAQLMEREAPELFV